MAETRTRRRHLAASSDADQPEEGKPIPRLNHKKSRTGCQRCRARRVKCNETKPVCGGCQRHRVPCVYDHHQLAANSKPLAFNEIILSDIRCKPGSATSTQHDGDGASDSPPDFSESRARRLLELRLFHHYTTQTAMTLLDADQPQTHDLFAVQMPRLAFENAGLLNSICFLSALHRAHSEAADSDGLITYRKYLDLALREHSHDLAHFHRSKADAACITSRFISIAAFVLLQERPLSPYVPPGQWMSMVRSAGRAYRSIYESISPDAMPVSTQLLQRTPVILDQDTLLQPSNAAAFAHLLTHSSDDDNDEVFYNAYQTPLAYIGGVHLSLQHGERTADVCRKLLTFVCWLDQTFIDDVVAQRPRALVVLAHYFALLAQFRDLWWIGDAGRREVIAIRDVLPDPWRRHMEWPLRVMEEKVLVT